MKLGLAHLTAIDLSPADLARAARRHGFDEIGLRLAPAVAGGQFYPLPDGSAAAAEFRRVADGEGIAVAEVEFVTLTPGADIAALAPLLASAAALGARALTVSGDDPDPARLAGHFAALCDLAQEHGLRVDLEFMRFRTTATLAEAVTVVRAAGQPNGNVLLDTLHFHRTKGEVAALQALPSGMVRAIQISDAPAQLPPDLAAVIHEARNDRLAPGEGALPLAAILRALPEATVSVEAPNAGRRLDDRLHRAQSGARALLAAVVGRGA